MSPEENKAVIRQFLEEVFGGGNLELVDELFAPDYVLHDPAVPGEVRGPEGIRQYVGMYRSAYPDTRFTIEDQLAEDDKVGCGFTLEATHWGEFVGIPPTRRRVTVTGSTILRFENGKCVERWSQTDFLGLMQQVGAIPAPEQTRV